MPNIDEAIDALLAYQQADMEGVMVLTSRQAIHEVADELRRLRDPAQQPLSREAIKRAIHPFCFSGKNSDAITDAVLALAAQPPAAPVEAMSPEQWVDKLREGTEFAETPLTRCSAGTADISEFRKLQDIIDNQADQILDLHEVLKSAYALNEFIAGAYILSLADFRYLNVVSTKIKAALPGGDVTPTEPQEALKPKEMWAMLYLHDWDPPKEGQEHRWEPGKNVFPEIHNVYETLREANAVLARMSDPKKYWVRRVCMPAHDGTAVTRPERGSRLQSECAWCGSDKPCGASECGYHNQSRPSHGGS